MQKFSLSDVTYKTAEVLQYLTHSLFSPFAPFSTPSKPELKLIMEVLEMVVTKIQCFVRCAQVENLTIFYREEGHKATAVRAALLTVMSYSVIVHDAQLSA